MGDYRKLEWELYRKQDFKQPTPDYSRNLDGSSIALRNRRPAIVRLAQLLAEIAVHFNFDCNNTACQREV
jgi:hypothetical protein